MLKKDIPKEIERPDYAQDKEENKPFLDEKPDKEALSIEDKKLAFQKQQSEYMILFNSLKPGQVLILKGIAFKIQKITKKDLLLRVIK